MKKIYLSCLSILSFGMLMAQENTGTIEYQLADPSQANTHPMPVLGEDRAPDDIIWSDDFSTGTNWTAGGPEMNATNTWDIGTSLVGWYFGTGGDMGTTGEFARLQVENPATITTGPLTMTYTGTIPDLTGIPAPHLEWEQFGARFITLQEIQISTDGGTTWLTAASNADIDPLTQGGGSVYGQPETRRFPISSVISGNPANVSIRLYWDGDMNGGNMNFIDYGWFVDNVRIVEGHSYDVELNEAYFVSGVELLEYYIVPTTQITTIDFSGEVSNQGAAIFEGMYLQADVDMGGNVFTGTSTPSDLAVGASDSVAATTMFTPANGTGTYDFTWQFLGDSADTFTGNEDHTDAIDVTDYTYSRDNDVQTGQINQIVGNTGQPFGIGNIMEIFADGVIGALDVYIADGASQDLIYGRVDLYNDGTQTFDWQGQSPDHSLTAGQLSGWTTLYFDPPIQVFTGDLILITANHYGSDVAFGYAQETFDGTVLGYDGAASLFGLASPNAIMVRADMRDFTGIDETSNPFSIAQNFPNPFDNNSIITYTLDEGADVSVTFTDVSGKIVKTVNPGMQNSGTYQIEIDGNDFAEGVYFYTFKIGDKEATKRMIVK